MRQRARVPLGSARVHIHVSESVVESESESESCIGVVIY